jgi:tellurite resistance protein TerC
VNGLVGVTYKVAKRIVIAIVGFTVLLLGIIMIVTPGPAIVLIPGGLAILGLEFAWARHWLKKARQTISNQSAKNRSQRAELHRQNHNNRLDR